MQEDDYSLMVSRESLDLDTAGATEVWPLTTSVSSSPPIASS